MKKNLLCMLLAGTMMTAAAAAAHADSTGVWTGVDFAPDAYYLYLGGVTALNSQDINTTDGWLARLDLGYGAYDYNTAAVPGGNVDADVTNAALMIGYRHILSNGSLTGFLGGDYLHHDQSPRDPLNKINGTEGGVKGQVELNVRPVTNVELKAYGNYSTAFNSYWTYATIGYDFGPFVLGPEVRALGNSDFHQGRIGASLSGVDLGFASAALSLGFADNSGRGNDSGMYGGLGFARNF